MNASRIARRVALAATAVVILTTVAHGWGIAVHDAARRPMTTVFVVEEGDSYVAWTRVFAPRSHVSVMWTANGTPDRILLLPLGDVDSVLQGEPVEPLAEFPTGQAIGGPMTLGRLDFAAPIPECPPPNGGCIDETVPVLLWLKGDAWRGASASDASYYVILNEAWDGPIVEEERHDGPVRPDISRSREGIVSNAPLWLGLAAAGAAIGGLAALAHVALELRRPREALVPPAPPTESTQTMLMLVRLTTLYVDGVRRSFTVSLAAILGITAAVMFLGLPPMLERVSEQFRHMWELMQLHVALFTLAPLYVALVACLFWLASYWRVRRELRHWRDLSRGFEEEAARLIGA